MQDQAWGGWRRAGMVWHPGRHGHLCKIIGGGMPMGRWRQGQHMDALG
ncbi:MAG: hypothetical protein R3A44_02510 [Caldilineaceae bacterium]